VNTALRTKIEVRFLGGLCGDNLTGSMTLLIVQKAKRVTRILIDAGLFQGKNSEKYNTQAIQSIDPREIDVVVITHVHNDHVGLLVWLAKNGFKGKIIATKQSVNIFPVVAEDSAKIQEEDYKKKIRALQHKKAQEKTVRPKTLRRNKAKVKLERLDRMRKEMDKIERRVKNEAEKRNLILYNRKDVENMLKREMFKNGGFDYEVPIRIAHGITVKFYSSDHVLGGASVVVGVEDKKTVRNLGFTSDLGKGDNIILPPLRYPKEKFEYILIESVYGDRLHPNREEDNGRYFEEIRRCYAEGKKITESVFAFQRSQESILKKTVAMLEGRIPEMPIYVDSPLILNLNKVFADCWDIKEISYRRDIIDFNPFKTEGKNKNPFLKYAETHEDSQKLIRMRGQFMVMACSGMGTSGRIVYHYMYGLPRDDSVFFILGYAVNETLNSKLARGEKIVEINKKPVKVRARINVFLGDSGHGDSDLLRSYVNKTLNKKTTKGVFIVHGPKEGGDSLKRNIIEDNGKIWEKKIFIPSRGEAFQL
jgi:metallo-beta-lactamase family protein